MNINSIPESFQSKFRIAIVSSLITGDKTFNHIKDLTQATDGNLSVHLSKLEEVGYITVSKEFVGRKPRTTYSLTKFGKDEFENYVKILEQLLNSAKND